MNKTIQSLLQQSMESQKAQERLIQQRLWQLEDQDTAFERQRQLQNLMLNRQESFEKFKRTEDLSEQNKAAGYAADVYGDIRTTLTGEPSPDPTNLQNFLSTVDPKTQEDFIKHRLTNDFERIKLNFEREKLGLPTLVIDKNNGQIVSVDPRTGKPLGPAASFENWAKTSETEGGARMQQEAYVKDIEKRMADGETFPKWELDSYQRTKHQLEGNTQFTLRSGNASGTITETRYEVGPDGVPRAIQKGERLRPGLSPTSRTRLEDIQMKLVAHMRELKNNMLIVDKEDFSYAQNAINYFTKIGQKLFGMDPIEYDGVMKDLVQRAPISEANKAAIERTFTQKYLYEVTKSQFTVKELQLHRKNYPNTDVGYYTYLAEGLALLKAQREHAIEAQYSLDNDTLPAIPGLESLEQMVQKPRSREDELEALIKRLSE